MKPEVVMDTNVALVANGSAEQANPDCVRACIAALKRIRSEQRLRLDVGRLILEEYRRNLSFSGQPGVGDVFFKWLWDNQANELFCRRVTITPLDSDPQNFAEYPADPELARFDPSDRKFVATALAENEPVPILNASDEDWSEFHNALARYVVVECVCPELMPPVLRS